MRIERRAAGGLSATDAITGWHETLAMTAMVVAWVCGVAVTVGWQFWLSVFFPPAAWVFLAKYLMGVP